MINKNTNSINLSNNQFIENNKFQSIIVGFKNTYSKSKLHHLIATAYFKIHETNEKILTIEEYYYLFYNLNIIGYKTFKIFRVINERKPNNPFKYNGEIEIKTFKMKIENYTEENKFRLFEVYTISIFDLFEYKDIFDSTLNYHLKSSNSIFIFENLRWVGLLSFFRENGFIISGGSNTKRFILSPLQVYVSQFVIALERVLDKDSKSPLHEVIKSYHQNEYSTTIDFKEYRQPLLDFTTEILKIKGSEIKNFLQSTMNLDSSEKSKEINNYVDNSKIDKESDKQDEKNNSNTIISKNIKYKSPILPVNKHFQKREYHSLIKNNIEKINTSNYSMNDKNENYLLSYLDSIKGIINNPELTPEQGQNLIENSWISLVTSKLEDSKFLIDRHSHRLANVIKQANITLDLLYNKKEIKRKFPELKDDLNKLEFLLLTFSLILTYNNRLKYSAMSILVGNSVIYLVYLNKRKEFMKSQIRSQEGITNSLHLSSLNSIKTFMMFDEFKSALNFSLIDSAKLGDFFISILTTYPTNLFEREFKPSNYFSNDKQELAEIKINPEYLNEIKENIMVHPSSLPMICIPNQWSDSSFGGFLENKTQGISVITGSSKHKHSVEIRDKLYKAINCINSIQFGINEDLLNFLSNEGKFILEDQLNSSDSLQRQITLKIAETFKNVPFYLNVHSDWRGRIYTQSFFISYQGGDLSSALLNFWEGESLNESGKYYLYIYGANNHNENNLSKASFEERIQWVKDNYDKIINLDPNLILSAENKFVFTAFCLNMKQLHNNPLSIIKTPVFLDATCSGIQHLAALLQDLELGSHVNLTPYNDKDKPGDIYSEIVGPINETLNKYGEENPDYINLSFVKFNRKLLKQSIMTKVYNVTNYGIANQLKSKLEKIDNKNLSIGTENTNEVIKNLKVNLKKSSFNYYIVPGIKGNVKLNSSDIAKIAQIINEQIFVLFPSLNYIYSYFIDITKLMIKLNIPVSWFTPSGMKITQHYLRSKQTSVAIRFAGKTKKIVLREWTDILNKQKQVQAIIPNIIHSLDANHLTNLINWANDNKFGPIITIHDCFGTHPNKMNYLIHKVKTEFILLYTQENFLDTFHNRIIQSIKDNQLQIIQDPKTLNNYVILNDQLLKIPNLPKLGELDLKKIIDSKYMIS